MKKDFITRFSHHPLASNLLMLIMLLGGLWALTQINTQFFPTFYVHNITVQVSWPGANAEDITRAITTPLEEKLRDVDYLKHMTSTSKLGSTTITLEFYQDADMGEAFNQVKQEVARVRNLPKASEPPVIKRDLFYETVANLLITTKGNLAELRPLVYQWENELLDKGISKITIKGLPEEEISIQISNNQLDELKLSLSQIAQRIANQSRDIPAGTIGKNEAARELRSLDQRRTIRGFLNLPIIHDDQGRIVRLKDIATISRRARDNEVHVYAHGKPAVEMTLYRTASGNTLTSAKILNAWLSKIRPTLPRGVQIQPVHETWKLVKERISLLLKNGGWGLVYILIILFLFLNMRIAWWTALGIPASFLAGIGTLYLLGYSINMISLFGMIMTLGIIVDDSIVVGEEFLSVVSKGENISNAVSSAARRMFMPVLASSLTTVFAFLPLMMISGIIGKVLFDIPLVVICVIIFSLVECFLVLPGHLNHSFQRASKKNKTIKQPILEPYLNKFKEKIFRPCVTVAIKNRWATVSAAFVLLLIIFGLIASHRVNFTFFPEPESTRVTANAQFSAGTSPAIVKAFYHELERSLEKTNRQLSPKKQSLIKASVGFLNESGTTDKEQGEEHTSLSIELISPEKRTVTNQKFIDTWRNNIKLPAGLESFSIRVPRSGPPGEDIDIELRGPQRHVLKQAANVLKEDLKQYHGVTNVNDDLPYGKEHWVFQLTTQGHAVGLTSADIGQQLHAAFQGELVQIFHEPKEEIEVRVMLPNKERYQLNALERFPVLTPQGETVPLKNVVKLTPQRGFDVLRHKNSYPTIRVTADVNNKVTNANKILRQLTQTVLPKLEQDYGLHYNLAGRSEDQADTFRDMGYGLLLALALIYIILAWVFSSYGWPILIMITIPIGLAGAIIGHLIMGIDLTILSLFGFFGLSGIVINDSIILANRYKELRKTGIPYQAALIEAACQRLRPVLITSITTILGLAPLIFEKSLQAKFLIPMAVSISFGLAFTTLLILIVIPSFLAIYESFLDKNKAHSMANEQ